MTEFSSSTTADRIKKIKAAEAKWVDDRGSIK